MAVLLSVTHHFHLHTPILQPYSSEQPTVDQEVSARTSSCAFCPAVRHRSMELTPRPSSAAYSYVESGRRNRSVSLAVRLPRLPSQNDGRRKGGTRALAKAVCCSRMRPILLPKAALDHVLSFASYRVVPSLPCSPTNRLRSLIPWGRMSGPIGRERCVAAALELVVHAAVVAAVSIPAPISTMRHPSPPKQNPLHVLAISSRPEQDLLISISSFNNNCNNLNNI